MFNTFATAEPTRGVHSSLRHMDRVDFVMSFFLKDREQQCFRFLELYQAKRLLWGGAENRGRGIGACEVLASEVLGEHALSIIVRCYSRVTGISVRALRPLNRVDNLALFSNWDAYIGRRDIDLHLPALPSALSPREGGSWPRIR
jgi:hypothetical protein